jgi:hypothetical protein
LKITDIRNIVFRPQKALKKTWLKLYNTLDLPTLLYGSENWTIKARDARRITAGYICTDHKTNTETAKELNVTAVLDKIQEYKRNWIKLCYYMPGQALRVPGGWGYRIYRQSAHEGGKVVSPTHRPPLPPRKYSWYSFLLEAESTTERNWTQHVNRMPRNIARGNDRLSSKQLKEPGKSTEDASGWVKTGTGEVAQLHDCYMVM